MPPYAGPSAHRSEDIAGTLRLLVALALAVALMVLDHRGGWLTTVRTQAEVLAQPLWRLAGLPARLGDSVRDDTATRARLAKENETLRNALLVSGARIARLQASAAENARLRGLLGAVEQGGLDVQLAPVLDVALDPTRQRLLLDIGAKQGVIVGQPALDAGGVLGQVIEVRSSTATVLLLTDPDHAIPVAVSRNGIRLVAYGRGDRLELANIPTSSDVKNGDLIVTSGLGGRFPPGFPVGTITQLRRDESRAFLVGDLKPAAQLDRGRDVLLLRRAPVRPPIGPAPAASATTAGTSAVETAPTAPGNAPSPVPPAASPAATSAAPAPSAPAPKEPAR
ncbi:MAG TPA: rod shape-determining protein MreC [Xanthomonadaceae bacterium]